MKDRTRLPALRQDTAPPKRANSNAAPAEADLDTASNVNATRQDNILQMQQRHGNAFVQRFIAGLNMPEQVVQRVDDDTAPVDDTTPPDDSAADALAPTDPGQSDHPVVRVGSHGPAVEELQQKLNGNGATLNPDGVFGPATQAAVRAFQTANGLSADGVVGLNTWHTLDATGAGSTIGRIERPWHETVGGQRYGMTSKYTWRITDTAITVTVNLHFTGADLSPVPGFLDAIRATWNRFNIVKPDTGDSLDLIFNPQSVTSGGDNTVAVKQSPPGTVGRSNSAEWFADDPDVGQTASHEFGHMIGLEDEYQRTHRDYSRVIGNEPETGADTGDAPAADVANEMHTALNLPLAQRVAACTQVIQNHSLQQGEFAEQIMVAYRANFGGNELVDDIVALIPDDDEFDIVDPFSHSSGTLMGDPSRHGTPADHAHPVQPRHVRQFVDFVTKARSGTWQAQER